MQFNLTQQQKSELRLWQEQIKKEHGFYGEYDYTFTPYPMGISIKVKSHLTGETKDLSFIDGW